MGVTESVENCIREAQQKRQAKAQSNSYAPLGHENGTLWHKLDHLLYLPILGLTRPRDLYYYQSDGLRALHGFTYKYLTLEHFLGQLTRLRVGELLADILATTYVQAWYPGDTLLYLFADWHVKPHWTKFDSHSGHVTMWGRTMPGTKQLIINGPGGYLLGGWNYPIDTHMTHILVELEADLSRSLQRLILCTILDSEGGGQPIGEKYIQAEQHYLSILTRQHDYPLTAFILQGDWETVIDDPGREAVLAHWAETEKAAADPRDFVLLRPIGQTELTRIYTGHFPSEWPASIVPWLHRRRWPHNELRIRELVNGANLNENYGYTYDKVTHRTRQRRWQTAQAKVEVTQRKLETQQAAIRNLRHQLAQLQQTFEQQRRTLTAQIIHQRLELAQRQQQEKPTLRCLNGLHRLRQEQDIHTARFLKRQRTLAQRLLHRQTHIRQLQAQLHQRVTARDAFDTETLCRERRLEKDQVMLNLQILLGNLHDWCKQHYFAPQWQCLTLEKATQLIYSKSGRVHWHPDWIEVVLDPYRYPEHQHAMQITCERFNQNHLRWRDGRHLHFSVLRPP